MCYIFLVPYIICYTLWERAKNKLVLWLLDSVLILLFDREKVERDRDESGLLNSLSLPPPVKTLKQMQLERCFVNQR